MTEYTLITEKLEAVNKQGLTGTANVIVFLNLVIEYNQAHCVDMSVIVPL